MGLVRKLSKRVDIQPPPLDLGEVREMLRYSLTADDFKHFSQW